MPLALRTPKNDLTRYGTDGFFTTYRLAMTQLDISARPSDGRVGVRGGVVVLHGLFLWVGVGGCTHDPAGHFCVAQPRVGRVGLRGRVILDSLFLCTNRPCRWCYALGEILVFDAGLSQMDTAKPLETLGNFPMNQVAFNS